MTRTWDPSILIVILLVLAAASVAVLVDDFASQGQEDERAEKVQRLLGGLGFGAAVDLSLCPFSFDPRLSCRCAADFFPISGGGWFCPRHACSIFYYPPLDVVAVPQRLDSEQVEVGNEKIP